MSSSSKRSNCQSASQPSLPTLALPQLTKHPSLCDSLPLVASPTTSLPSHPHNSFPLASFASLTVLLLGAREARRSWNLLL